ncbi:RICIN domain-containing protein [Streptomyces sp. GQFP]|uniref:RICIN domain-containing protein n=1 Tax=Streptomyces sp. GQFP TaxID=2907545 RepID=UPI001F3567A0|nr:hypothetical protein [Streptomyces sp. GQFP]UIX35710.1 hypothetical protein LUX31_25525 [Streptomyces sp. GQFP]
MNEQREGGLRFVLWTTDDFPDYSKLSGAQQHEILEALVGIRAEADKESGISRPPKGIQSRGDGEAVCWKKLTAVPYLKQYVPALSDALDKANKRRSGDVPKLRLRLAVTYGATKDGGGGAAGTPPIEAERLVSSRPCKDVSEKLADSGLVVIISDRVFQDVVKQGWDGLDPKAYVPVKVQDKHGTHWAAHITVPGAAPGRVRAVFRRQRMIKPAVCAAAVVVVALGLVGALTPWSWSSSSQGAAEVTPDAVSTTPDGTPSPTPSVTPSPSPSVSESGPAGGAGSGSLISAESGSPDPAPTPTPTKKPSPTPPKVTYRPGMAENVGDGLVMALYDDSVAEGTGVTVVPAGSSRSQRWTTETAPFGPYSESEFFIYNELDTERSVALALDSDSRVGLASTANGVTFSGALSAWTSPEVEGGSGKAWYLKSGDGCLTDHGKNKQLTVTTCQAGNKAQQWILH